MAVNPKFYTGLRPYCFSVFCVPYEGCHANTISSLVRILTVHMRFLNSLFLKIWISNAIITYNWVNYRLLKGKGKEYV